jgi:hypothetical protein
VKSAVEVAEKLEMSVIVELYSMQWIVNYITVMLKCYHSETLPWKLRILYLNFRLKLLLLFEFLPYSPHTNLSWPFTTWPL